MESGNSLGINNNANAPRASQQKVLQGCKQHVDEYIEGLFKQVADKLDDVLFDRSNQGGKDANDYLAAARELRVRRQELAQAFRDRYAQSYKSRLNYSAFAMSAVKKDGGSGSGLSLLDEQALEESLAIDGLVAKANDRFSNELFALAQRFNALISGAKYEDDTQPLCPELICHAFRDTVDGLPWKVESKLIAYKLLDKAVMQGMGEFYQQTNRMLARAGILPDLRLSANIRQVGPQAGGHASAQGDGAGHQAIALQDDGLMGGMVNTLSMPGGASGGSMSGDIYQALQQMMNIRKYGNADISGVAGGMAVPQGPAVAVDELVRGLSLLQHVSLPVDTSGVVHVAAIKEALVDQFRQLGDGRALNPAHDNTIDVIGMIFEFILDEPSIPNVVKNLLNRLQIPILKIAIADREFFTNKSHAARRLLNVLGHASIGWNDKSEEIRQQRFAKMEAVVNRVLDEFEQDPGVFAVLLDDFTEFLAQQGGEIEEETDLAEEQETQEVPPERIAFEAVETRLEGMEVPVVLRDFLRVTWRSVLQHAIDNGGYDSELWRRREQTLDDLMWSVEPKTTPDARRKMMMSLPHLLDELRDGMALVGCEPQEMDKVINALEPIHMACMRGVKPEIEPPVEIKPAVRVKEESSSDELVDLVRSMLGGGPDDAQQGAVGKSADGAVPDLMDELLGMETSLDLDDELSLDEQRIDDEFSRQAEEMPLGTWLEFVLDDAKRRGKLAWKSAVMGEFVFVDRKYKVVAERTTAQLADDLRQGRAARVEHVPIFDRALDKVMNGLMSSGVSH